MAQALLQKEVLNLEDVEGLLGKRPYMSAELRNIDRYRGHEAPAPSEPSAGPEGEVGSRWLPRWFPHGPVAPYRHIVIT